MAVTTQRIASGIVARVTTVIHSMALLSLAGGVSAGPEP